MKQRLLLFKGKKQKEFGWKVQNSERKKKPAGGFGAVRADHMQLWSLSAGRSEGELRLWSLSDHVSSQCHENLRSSFPDISKVGLQNKKGAAVFLAELQN